LPGGGIGGGHPLLLLDHPLLLLLLDVAVMASAEATAAATALVRLHTALGEHAAKLFDGLPAYLTPLQMAEDIFDSAGCVLYPAELRGLMSIMADWGAHEIRIPVEALKSAVLAAPRAQPEEAAMVVEDVEEKDEQMFGAAAAAPPAPAPARVPPPDEYAAAAAAAAWTSPDPPAEGLTRTEQRQHYVRQGRAAPFATMPVTVTSQFGERVRPAGAAALAWVDGRTSREPGSTGFFTGTTVAAEAAVAARRAGKGAAGLGASDLTAQQLSEQSARAALLFAPNQRPATAQAWVRSSPFAMHEDISGLQSPGAAKPSSSAEARTVEAAARHYSRRVPPTEAPPAPFATWSEQQLGALHRADGHAPTASGKLGPTLWRPSSAPGFAGSTAPPLPTDRAAGLVAQYGEAGGGAWPVPKEMTWMNTSGAARPVSRKGGGEARPNPNASTFSLGWQ
jgi:hypothetical protein